MCVRLCTSASFGMWPSQVRLQTCTSQVRLHTCTHQVQVVLDAAVRKQDITVTVRPWLLSVVVAGRGVVLRGSLHRAVVSAETVWVLEAGALMQMPSNTYRSAAASSAVLSVAASGSYGCSPGTQCCSPW